MRRIPSCAMLGAALFLGGVCRPASAQPSTSNAPTKVAATATNVRAYTKFSVQLEVDDSLVGEVKKFDDAGILVPAKGTPVKIYKDGRLVKAAKTDDNGIFQAAKLSPGAYSIMSGDLLDGRKGFSAISVDVVPYVSTTAPRWKKKSDVSVVKVPAPADAKLPPRRLPIALIPPADVAFLRQKLVGQFQRAQPSATPAMRVQPRRDVRVSSAPADQSLAYLLASAPGGQPLIANVSKNANVSKKFERINTTTFHRPSEFNHQMFVGEGGAVEGSISSLDPAGGPKPITSGMIYYRRNKAVHAQAVVSDGMFHAKGIVPGVYSVIIVTPSSFGAFAVEYLPMFDDTDPTAPETEDANRVPTIKQAAFAKAEMQPPPTETTVPSDEDSNGYLRDQIGVGTNAALAGTTGTPGGAVGGGAGGPGALAAVAAAAGVGLALSQSDESPQP